MRYLAIDLGRKRTGLAVGDDTTGLATPLAVIEAGGEPARFEAIAQAAREHGAGALVVGLPVNMDGGEGPAAKAARAAGAELGHRLKLPVHFVDERLSSFEADKQMSGSGLTHKGKKRRRDALAAAVLLRDFLASRQA